MKGLLIIYTLLIGLLLTGYVKNVIKLTECDFEPSYKAEIIHGVGLFPPVGVIVGWMDGLWQVTTNINLINTTRGHIMSHSISANQLANKVKQNNEKVMKRIAVAPRYEQRNKTKHHALASSNPVFVNHKWGDSTNAGVHYQRPYSKTNSSAKAYMKSIDA